MSDSPLGSPISSSRASPLPQKDSPIAQSGDLQGRKAVPLSQESDSDSFAGSPVAKQAQQIEQTSDKTLLITPDATKKNAPKIAEKEVAILSDLELDELDQLADQLLQQRESESPKSVAAEINAIFTKMHPEGETQTTAALVTKEYILDSRLIDAYKAGHHEQLSELILSGVSIDARNDKGETLIDVVLQTIRLKDKSEATEDIELALDLLTENADSSKMSPADWKVLLNHVVVDMSPEDFEDLDCDTEFPKTLLSEQMKECLESRNWQGVERLHRIGVSGDFVYKGVSTFEHAYKHAQETGNLDPILKLAQLLPSQTFTCEQAKKLLSKIESQGRLAETPQSIFHPLIVKALQEGNWTEIFTLLEKGAFPTATYSGDKLMNHAYNHAKDTNELLPIRVFLKQDASEITLSENECKDLLERLYAAGHLDEAPSELIMMVFKHLPIASLCDVKNSTWMAVMSQLLTSNRLILKQYGFSQSLLDTLFMHFAKTTGNTAMLTKLIFAGATIDKQDEQGNTALHYAFKNSDSELCLKLLKHGANYNILNAAIKCPIDLGQPGFRTRFSTIEETLNRRFHALSLDPLLEAKKISDQEIRQIAFMIEIIIPQISAQIGKIHKSQTGSTHSLLYRKAATGSSEIRELYVLLQKGGTIKGSGTSKKASEAIKLPLALVNDTAERLAMVITKKNLSTHELDNVVREAAIYEALKDLPGIWPLLSVCDYTQQTGSETKRRIALMSVPGTTSFYAAKLDQPELINTARQISQGLAGMHDRGYFHGDFKGDNALVAAERAGVIDFGFTKKLKAGDKASFPFSYGFYGSLFCTAPELFGNRQFAGQGGDFSKLDVFAYGDMLYRKHFHPTSEFVSQTPWCSLLMKYHQTFQTVAVSAEDIAQFETLLDIHVVIPLNLLELKAMTTTLTKEEQLQMVIYKALHPDPASRATMAETATELTRIEALKS